MQKVHKIMVFYITIITFMNMLISINLSCYVRTYYGWHHLLGFNSYNFFHLNELKMHLKEWTTKNIDNKMT